MKKIIAIVLSLFLAACEQHVLSQSDSGKITNLKQGEHFQIDLPENPTTGYQWAFLSNPQNSDVVRFDKSDYIAKEGPLLGAGGRKVLTYTATQKGTVELRGFYKRNYENIFMLDALGEPRVRYIIVVR